MWWIIIGIISIAGLPAAIAYAKKDRYQICSGGSWYWKGRGTAAVLVAGVVVAAWFIAVSTVMVSTRACEQTGAAAGYGAEWTLFTGCLVDTPIGTFPLDQILELRNGER